MLEPVLEGWGNFLKRKVELGKCWIFLRNRVQAVGEVKGTNED